MSAAASVSAASGASSPGSPPSDQSRVSASSGAMPAASARLLRELATPTSDGPATLPLCSASWRSKAPPTWPVPTSESATRGARLRTASDEVRRAVEKERKGSIELLRGPEALPRRTRVAQGRPAPPLIFRQAAPRGRATAGVGTLRGTIPDRLPRLRRAHPSAGLDELAGV